MNTKTKQRTEGSKTNSGLYKGRLYTVAYLLRARTVEPEKQPLLANGFEITF
jgi:hypothetical protein